MTRKKEKTEYLHWKRMDGLIILLAVVLSLLPLGFLRLGGADAASVRVEQHGEVLYTGSLAADAVITTPDGGNVIEIKGGTVRMVYADCSDGLCLAAGEATALRPIVCLPNEVTVSVIRKEEVGYDVIVE